LTRSHNDGNLNNNSLGSSNNGIFNHNSIPKTAPTATDPLTAKIPHLMHAFSYIDKMYRDETYQSKCISDKRQRRQNILETKTYKQTKRIGTKHRRTKRISRHKVPVDERHRQYNIIWGHYYE
jgi:nicotinamide mononucleotide adenylyltransferase